MNRDIKFRFWQTNEKYMLNWDEINQSSLYELLTAIDSVPMQFTGLTDKNGKEIYEGDIVKPTKFIDIPNVVEYVSHGFYRAKTHENGKKYFNPLGSCQVEIIGNIYENPELIIKL